MTGGCSLPPATSHTCLVDVVEGGALIGPVAIALLDAVLGQRAQHDDDGAAVLPHHLRTRDGGGYHRWMRSQAGGRLSHCDSFGRQHPEGPRWASAQLGDTHLPEVSNSVGQWPLCGNVCWHPWVVLDLGWERGCQTA